MFDIVLHQPEIPPNTGNVIRLCANSGARLHLVAPLGFSLEDRLLRRAGLDYHEYARIRVHASLEEFLALHPGARIWATSARGRRRHVDADFRPDDVLLFGCETRGLPEAVLGSPRVHEVLRIPMQPGVRSINLSNAVAIVLYEAWRQQGFAGSGAE